MSPQCKYKNRKNIGLVVKLPLYSRRLFLSCRSIGEFENTRRAFVE